MSPKSRHAAPKRLGGPQQVTLAPCLLATALRVHISAGALHRSVRGRAAASEGAAVVTTSRPSRTLPPSLPLSLFGPPPVPRPVPSCPSCPGCVSGVSAAFWWVSPPSACSLLFNWLVHLGLAMPCQYHVRVPELFPGKVGGIAYFSYFSL